MLESLYKEWSSKYGFVNNRNFRGGSSYLRFSLRNTGKGTPYIRIDYEESGQAVRGYVDPHEYSVSLASSEGRPNISQELYVIGIDGDTNRLPFYITNNVGKGLSLLKIESWLSGLASINKKADNGMREGHLLRKAKAARSKRAAESLYKVGDYVRLATQGHFVGKIVEELGPNRFKVEAKSINPLSKAPPQVKTYFFEASGFNLKPVKMKHVGVMQDLSDDYGHHFIMLLPDGNILNGTDDIRLKQHYNLYTGGKNAYFNKYALEPLKPLKGGDAEEGEEEDILAELGGDETDEEPEEEPQEEPEEEEEEASPEDLLITIRDNFINGNFGDMVEGIQTYGGLNQVLTNKTELGLTPGDLIRLCHIYTKKLRI